MTSVVIPILSLLFMVAFVGRLSIFAAEIDQHSPEHASIQTVRSEDHLFWELDRWESELNERQDALESKALATDIALHEAKRAAAVAQKHQNEWDEKKVSVRRIAALFGAMDPVQASKRLENLSSEKVALIISAMSPEVAGPILAELPPKVATAITDRMITAQDVAPD